VLKSLDIDIERTRNEILRELDPQFSGGEAGGSEEAAAGGPQRPGAQAEDKKEVKTPALKAFGRDLTEIASVLGLRNDTGHTPTPNCDVDARDILNCIASKWGARLERKNESRDQGRTTTISDVEAHVAVTADEIIDRISSYPTTNKQTHFATIWIPRVV